MDMFESIPGVDPLTEALDASEAKTAERWSLLGRRIRFGAKSVGSTCDGRATPLFLREQTVPLKRRSTLYFGDLLECDDVPF